MRSLLVAATLLIACGDNGVAPTRVDVMAFGARGDGVTDDTAAMQTAIDSVSSGGTITIPDGTYRINAAGPNGGLRLHSHQVLELSPQAVLEVIPNDAPEYGLVRVYEQTDVTVRGGILIGDRDGHLGTTGEKGHGVGIRSSDHVVVENVIARDFWGDGFYVGPIPPMGPPCHDVRVSSVVGDHNRRQGISITNAYSVIVENSRFMNTTGTNPQAGIDLEPSLDGRLVRDVQLFNNTFINNTFGVLIVHLAGVTEDIIVANNEMSNNSIDGVALIGDASNVLIYRNVIRDNARGIMLDRARDDRIEDNLVEHNLHHGIALTSASYNSLSGNVIVANSDSAGVYDNIYIDDHSNSNVIERNRIRRGQPAVSRYGIQIATPDCIGNSIIDNDLSCAGMVAAILDQGTTTTVRTRANELTGVACSGFVDGLP